MLASRPAAVLFDLDGTLVETERENVESVVLACRRLGAELSAEERQFIIGHSWNEIHAQLAANHRLRVSMAELIAMAVDEKRVLLEATGYRALPGAVDVVTRLANAGVPLAVASGASCVEVREALQGVSLARYFPVALGAEDYQRGKPEPEPYLMAMDRLGVRSEASRCIVVEDATPGILAGRAAGARVVAVRAGNFAGYDLSPAHVVLDTLEELTDELCARLLA